MHRFVTLSCISNPVGGDLIGTIRWTGVSLKGLLPELMLTEAATHLRITSADGFSESLAIETIRNDERIMLAYAWDGVPLPAAHGFPLRIHIPDLYNVDFERDPPRYAEPVDGNRYFVFEFVKATPHRPRVAVTYDTERLPIGDGWTRVSLELRLPF